MARFFTVSVLRLVLSLGFHFLTGSYLDAQALISGTAKLAGTAALGGASVACSNIGIFDASAIANTVAVSATNALNSLHGFHSGTTTSANNNGFLTGTSAANSHAIFATAPKFCTDSSTYVAPSPLTGLVLDLTHGNVNNFFRIILPTDGSTNTTTFCVAAIFMTDVTTGATWTGQFDWFAAGSAGLEDYINFKIYGSGGQISVPYEAAGGNATEPGPNGTPITRLTWYELTGKYTANGSGIGKVLDTSLNPIDGGFTGNPRGTAWAPGMIQIGSGGNANTASDGHLYIAAIAAKYSNTENCSFPLTF